MVSLAALWLPALVSAIAVFIASSILHMVFPYHRSDYKQLPDEDRILGALRSVELPRGLYMFPYCTHKDMKSPAMEEKRKLGPVGSMTIFPKGSLNMGKFLGMWFVYCLIVGTLVALMAGQALAPGADHHTVIHVTFLSSFLAYGASQLVNGIWGGQPWSNVAKQLLDGVIYAVLTGFTFGWLWPR